MNRKALFSVGFLGAGLFLALPSVYAAGLTKEDEKKAAAAASDAADKWAASQKEPEKPTTEVSSSPPKEVVGTDLPSKLSSTVPSRQSDSTGGRDGGPSISDRKMDSPPVAAGNDVKKEVEKPIETAPQAKSAVSPVAPKKNLNEMTGKIISIEDDPRIIRVALDGGYNIEFTYDNTTVFVNGGSPIKPKDLYYGDKVQVFYAGKNLNAVEIERLEKAPRPFAE